MLSAKYAESNQERNLPTFWMDIYYQWSSVETNRGESMRVPIRGRHSFLLALLFLFPPEAHPPADCCSSPRPDGPTAPLRQESRLQQQKDAELFTEGHFSRECWFCVSPVGALQWIQLYRHLVCKQMSAKCKQHLNTLPSWAGACGCVQLLAVGCRSCLALLQSLGGFPAVFHIPRGAAQNPSSESSSKAYRKEGCNQPQQWRFSVVWQFRWAFSSAHRYTESILG